MNDPDTRAAAARAALLDLVLLRLPVDMAGVALAPHLLDDHQGAPLAVFDRSAMRTAITACRSGTLTSRELRHWALMVHELTSPLGYPGRDPLLRWEPRAKRLLHYHVHRLLEAGEDGVTHELLQQIEADLAHTDWTWITHRPSVATVCEAIAAGAWAFLAAPALAPHLPQVFTTGWVALVGGFAISVAITRWLRGTDAAIERFQQIAPYALLAAAAIGVAYALGGNG